MSRRRRQTSRPQTDSAAPSEARAAVSQTAAIDGPPRWPTLAACVLLAVRYFLPAESAPLGDTLWVVQIWLMTAVVWLWLAARAGDRLRSFDQLDIAIALLVGGHVLSAGVVLLDEGDKRAALNMFWEWVGIGVAALMIRDVVRSQFGRSRLLGVVVVSSMTLAGLGLWQHHVWYPSMVRKLAEYDRLLSTAPADPEGALQRNERLRSLQRELGPLVAGGDEAADQLMRSRIAASTEAIGRFALANTLAGLLLVGLLIACGQMLGATGESSFAPRKNATETGRGGNASDRKQKGALSRSERRLSAAELLRGWRWWACALLVTGVAYCFWLTKCRTGLVGLLAGLTVWYLLARRGQRWTTGLRRAALAGGVLLVVLPVIAGLSGSLDRQVITEAPKSLQYRLEYWTATGGVIKDAPLLGVGPGNFRQAYLRHKLPGSSEEILDPHNLFLDVWANGGLLALAGLLWMIVLIIRRIGKLAGGRVRSEAEGPAEMARPGRQPPDASINPLPPSPEAIANPTRSILVNVGIGIAAMLLAAFVSLMTGGGLIEGIWWLAAGWCLVCLVWPAEQDVAAPVIAAAALALLVHLMGAGGIAMPAILLTLILLSGCVIRTPDAGSNEQTPPEWSALPQPLPWRPMLGAGICLCLSIACAFTATLPVSAARTQLSLGEAILAEGRSPREALRAFESAIEADPLDAEPWQQLALAHAADWKRGVSSDPDAFDHAVQALQEAIDLDPLSAARRQLLGDLWWLRYQDVVDRTAAGEALAAYQQAARLYPHLASLQAKLARAALAAGAVDLARDAAGRALKLDEANRLAGHVDKYLPDAQREAMQSLVGREQE